MTTAIVILALASLVSAPIPRLGVFSKFPSFRVSRDSNNHLYFDDAVSGDWFLQTSPVISLEKTSGVFTAKTASGSVYRFVDANANSNTFYKVSFVDYEVHEERPDWAREACQMSTGTWVVKTYNNSFHTSKEDADERAEYLLHCYDGSNSEEVRVAKEMGCIKLNGVFKVTFDEDFIKAVEKWSKRISSYGEFGFRCRAADRKQMREELAPATLDKIERRNRLDYMREFA